MKPIAAAICIGVMLAVLLSLYGASGRCEAALIAAILLIIALGGRGR